MAFASRAGQKLDHAISAFGVEVRGLICADLGCSTGGFTDCLLQHGAAKVYAVDTGYGVLDWKLRNDPRVVVMERRNAMHVTLPEPVSLVSIDVGWTPQRLILPSAAGLLAPGGQVLTLIKPHYEASKQQLRGGVLPDDQLKPVLLRVQEEMQIESLELIALTFSPIRGTGGNAEMLALLRLGQK